MFWNYLKPTGRKVLLTGFVLIFFSFVSAIVGMSLFCSRRDCVPPEAGGTCTTPAICDYDVAILVLAVIIPIAVYVVYSYIQFKRQ